MNLAHATKMLRSTRVLRGSIVQKPIEKSHDKTLIKVNNLTVKYRGKTAIENVSCALKKGRVISVIGPNGAGKSTIFKAVLGIVKPETGDVKFARDLGKRDIAYIEQRSALDLSFPISVQEVVLLGTYPKLGLLRRPGREEKERAVAALETVQMGEYENRQIGELSGGQLQRVFIARALAQQAKILLLDEPFTGIDTVSESLIVEVLKCLTEKGKAVSIVHHDLHKVEEYFDDIVILNRVLIAQGPVEATFNAHNINKAYGDALGRVVVKGE